MAVRLSRLVLPNLWLCGWVLLAACAGPAAPPATPTPAASPTPDAAVVPTAAAGKAVVYGVLVDIRTAKPAPQTIMYLETARVGDVPLMLYGPRDNQPRTTSDAQGRFVFTDVAPGEYVVIIYSPIDITYLQESDGRALLVTVTGDQQLDLGERVNYVP